MEAKLGGQLPLPLSPIFPALPALAPAPPGKRYPARPREHEVLLPLFILIFFEASINDSSGTEPSTGPGAER